MRARAVLDKDKKMAKPSSIFSAMWQELCAFWKEKEAVRKIAQAEASKVLSGKTKGRQLRHRLLKLLSLRVGLSV
jgi:hypothetical protein|tara:strand:+ start:696 stop:920 length:225 start_codon:yes stop_codon:yes gene_type:complete